MRKIKDFQGFLNEKRAQLDIPFAGYSKMHHEHIIDAMEDAQVMKPEAYKSSADVDKLVDAAIPEATEEFQKETEGIRHTVFDFVYRYFEEEDTWTPAFLQDNDFELDDYDDQGEDMADAMIGKTNIKDSLTRNGKATWDEYMREKINDDSWAMWDTVLRSAEKDPDGLISVWRAIDFGKGKEKDVYDKIMNDYHGGIGEYWSWEQRQAEAHWGGGGADSKLFIMHGQVRPEDVNWVETVRKSVYDLREEEEIELIRSSAVKLIGITTEDESKKDVFVKFEQPYVVKVGEHYKP